MCRCTRIPQRSTVEVDYRLYRAGKVNSGWVEVIYRPYPEALADADELEAKIRPYLAVSMRSGGIGAI
ncbi:hypothetical protein HUB94_28120 (plasmid) [Paenibacillus cellulosilyticus]|uniref:hypothetical protein n=1 Tax=Paenibacillus cellulosilyticus TaxID=375489 RepID=UPI0011B44CAA|nr:hypothetical protein [Paenibacillus cellulosilyticus]QKS48148.1 hypothetical protein HUB94_28120 [Paenibacillus cellulosilyticus]